MADVFEVFNDQLREIIIGINCSLYIKVELNGYCIIHFSSRVISMNGVI